MRTLPFFEPCIRHFYSPSLQSLVFSLLCPHACFPQPCSLPSSSFLIGIFVPSFSLCLLLTDATYVISEIKDPMDQPRLIFDDSPPPLSFTAAGVQTCSYVTAYLIVSILHCRFFELQPYACRDSKYSCTSTFGLYIHSISAYKQWPYHVYCKYNTTSKCPQGFGWGGALQTWCIRGISQCISPGLPLNDDSIVHLLRLAWLYTH